MRDAKVTVVVLRVEQPYGEVLSGQVLAGEVDVGVVWKKRRLLTGHMTVVHISLEIIMLGRKSVSRRYVCCGRCPVGVHMLAHSWRRLMV